MGRRAMRRGMMSLLMFGSATAGVTFLGVNPAGASGGGIKGMYALTFDWGVYRGNTTPIAFGRNHKFITGAGAESGTYRYRRQHHELTFRYIVPNCGAVFTGTGSPSSGFAGTSVITNPDGTSGCLPTGTTGTWSTGPKGS